jgi:hypothetical protein
MKLISLFTKDFGITINLFYIISFPLTSLISFYVFKKFNIPTQLSFLGAILFAFLPYHFAQGINHLNLTSYNLIPLSVMLALWIMSGELTIPHAGAVDPEAKSKNKKMFWEGMAICFLVSSSGTYYAYFSCLFLMLAGTARSFWSRKLVPAATAAMLISVIFIGLLINISPTFIYHITHGNNPSPIARVYHDTELYALKMTNMLLPSSDHRIKAFADIRKQYNRESSYLYRFKSDKSESSSIGMLSSVGFIILICALFFIRRGGFETNEKGDGVRRLYHLSLLNVFAFLTATVCGFASFIAPLIRFKIRAYNRMSIFIAFFSIFALLIMLNILYKKYVKDKFPMRIKIGNRDIKLTASSSVLYVFFIVMTAIGVYDQSGTRSVPHYSAVASEFRNDESFIDDIEQAMPKNSMIFQLPYCEYPENKQTAGDMVVYEHFKCYLHSTFLRWSFGAMKGRETDEWQKKVSLLPAAVLLKEITLKGFSGLCLNRKGYPDNGEAKIKEIQKILKIKPIVHKDGSLVFFKI